MRKYLLIMIALLISFSFGCKSDSDVLATYNDGKITRGEFYSWMESRHMSKEAVVKSKAKQKSKLRQIALDRLTVVEARKAGFDKTEDFKTLQELVRHNFITGFFRKEIRSDVKFKEDAVNVSIIKLMVKNYSIDKNKRKKLTDQELEKAFAEKMKEAGLVVGELDKGADFAEVAKKKSDDYSKKKGGSIGFITKGMRDPKFTDAAFALKKGEYTKQPVRIRNGVYIIKVNDRETLTSDNIEDVIENENQAKRLKKRLQANVARDLEKKLLEAKDVENNIEKASLKDRNAVLFKIGAESYKVGDLNDLIDFIYKKRAKYGKKNLGFDDDKKKKVAERMFREKLMMKEALGRGIDKEEKFIRDWDTFQEFTLAGAYKNDVILADIEVTPKEVKDEYAKNKKREAQKNKKGNPKPQKTKSFNEVKDRIEYMIFNRKKSAKRRVWEKDLLKKSNFVVNEDKLEEEKK